MMADSGDHPYQRGKPSPRRAQCTDTYLIFGAYHKGVSEPTSKKARVKMQDVPR